jgi:hypothetical protein
MSWKQERARVASLSRSRPDNDPDLVAARRNMRAELLAEHVERVLGEAPPLTDIQREKIAALLRVGGAA